MWSRFWEFWGQNLKSHLQLHYVPVHETRSAMVGKIITTSKTPSLNRIDCDSNGLLSARNTGALQEPLPALALAPVLLHLVT